MNKCPVLSNRTMSPLKSPILQRHLNFENNIHYPQNSNARFNKYIDKNGNFCVSIDVHDYDRKMITVETNGHIIEVTLEHGDKFDNHGLISRKMVRKYVLPSCYDMSKITSEIEADTLKIIVPSPQKDVGKKRIPIHIK